jgi:hypothetical protein
MPSSVAHQIVFEQLQEESRARRCRCGCGCRHRNSDPTTGHCRDCDAGDCGLRDAEPAETT